MLKTKGGFIMNKTRIHVGNGVSLEKQHHDAVANKIGGINFIYKGDNNILSFRIKDGVHKIGLIASFFNNGLGKSLKKKDVRAIIDTGAQSICLRDTQCQKLGLKKFGEVSTMGANSRGAANLYKGNLSLFQGKAIFKNVTVVGLPLPSNVDALIGWPVFKFMVLHLDEGQKWYVSFPKP